MKRDWNTFRRGAAPRGRRNSMLRSLRIERFEERRVMDGSFAGLDELIQDTTLNISVISSPVRLYDDGTLVISGTEASDDVRVTAGGNMVYVVLNEVTYSFERTTPFAYHASSADSLLLGPPIYLDLPNVTQIEFYGGNGHDRFQNDTDLPTFADGGKGNDFLIGGSAADRLVGGDGDDALLGRESADTLSGEAGVDRLQGNEGRDTLRGGANNDELFGGTEDDKLSGDAGNDAIYGQEGVDTLWGGDGHDDLHGGAGLDDLVGGAGVDWFEPGPDNVWIDDPETGYLPYDGSTQIVTINDNKSLTKLVPHNENLAGVTAFLDLNNQWSMNLETTRQRILDRLGAARPGGESLYDVSLTLPGEGYQEIAQDEWGTHLRLTVRGAYLEATSTQPTVLGSWADPRFGVSFDITVDVHLAPTGGLRVTSTLASISNAKIHAANVVSDVLDFFNTVAGFFTGINFKSLAEQSISGTQFKNAIDTSMTSLINVLAPGASVVYDVANGVVLMRTARQGPPIDINKFTWEAEKYTSNASLEAVYAGTGVATTLDQANMEMYQSPWTDVFEDIRFSESYSSPIPGGDLDIVGAVSVASDFDWAMLNPQPLPPKELYFGELASELDLVALNPQPLPPGESFLSEANFASDFDWALLNPQPLPPKDDYSDAFASDLDWVALNPQPLPPKEVYFDGLASDLDLVALNPQPLPPGESFLSDENFASDFDWALLNPQPLPPKEDYSDAFASDLDWVALNPQPLPPQESFVASVSFASQFDAVALNPQPLPPKDFGLYTPPVVSYARLPSARFFAW